MKAEQNMKRKIKRESNIFAQVMFMNKMENKKNEGGIFMSYVTVEV